MKEGPIHQLIPATRNRMSTFAAVDLDAVLDDFEDSVLAKSEPESQRQSQPEAVDVVPGAGPATSLQQDQQDNVSVGVSASAVIRPSSPASASLQRKVDADTTETSPPLPPQQGSIVVEQQEQEQEAKPQVTIKNNENDDADLVPNLISGEENGKNQAQEQEHDHDQVQHEEQEDQDIAGNGMMEDVAQQEEQVPEPEQQINGANRNQVELEAQLVDMSIATNKEELVSLDGNDGIRESKETPPVSSTTTSSSANRPSIQGRADSPPFVSIYDDDLSEQGGGEVETLTQANGEAGGEHEAVEGVQGQAAATRDSLPDSPPPYSELDPMRASTLSTTAGNADDAAPEVDQVVNDEGAIDQGEVTPAADDQGKDIMKKIQQRGRLSSV